MRHVMLALVTSAALNAMPDGASADTCSQATAAALNKLSEAVSLGTVLKPNDASNPIMCPAARKTLKAYREHLALFEEQQIQCRSTDAAAVNTLRESIDRIRIIVIPRYCK